MLWVVHSWTTLFDTAETPLCFILPSICMIMDTGILAHHDNFSLSSSKKSSIGSSSVGPVIQEKKEFTDQLKHFSEFF